MLVDKLKELNNMISLDKSEIHAFESKYDLRYKEENSNLDTYLKNETIKLICQNTTNSVLEDAMYGTVSIEESLLELKEKSKKVNSYFKFSKLNKNHNQRLDEIGELIGYSQFLETGNNLSKPRNLPSQGIFGGIFALGTYLLINTADNGGVSNELYTYLTAFSGLGTIGFLSFAYKSFENNPQENAKYLDNILKENNLYKVNLDVELQF